MPTPNLSSMSVDALLKLRADIEQALTRRAAQLRDELSKLSGSRGKVGTHPLAGRKAPIKFRDRAGNTWAGRGAKPKWLVEALKAGKKIEDFLIKSARKRRRAKRQKVAT
jgi:DNA-binding protein H-NS